MKSKNPKKQLTAGDILNYLRLNAGQKYSLAALCLVMKIGRGQLLLWLSELSLKGDICTVTNHTKYFFVPSAHDLSPRMNFMVERPFKPLVLPKGFGERRKELYPEGHSFSNMGGKS
jgi:hypothetical protein